jgi:putative ABC transport system permease protein
LWRCWLLLSGQPGSFLVRRHPSHEVLRTRGLDTQGDESGNPLATALRVVSAATELFGRLAPGVTVEQARAELRSVYGAMTKEHPEAYSAKADFQIGAKRFRDQITSGARTVLLVLLAASALVFIIACCNVANLILTRIVRREGELATRAALGASTGALRRMLLAESLLLCGAGAALGVMSAQPMVAILARYASRFSVRALDLTVDSSLLWVGAAPCPWSSPRSCC